MNRVKLAEFITIVASVATIISGGWSLCCQGSKRPARLEAFGVRAIVADELAGKIELTDQQIDELAALKIRSVQNLRPLMHQLCADVRRLKALRTARNCDIPCLRQLEQDVLKDQKMIIDRNLEDHQTANRILGS
jgi:hypothetical protein